MTGQFQQTTKRSIQDGEAREKITASEIPPRSYQDLFFLDSRLREVKKTQLEKYFKARPTEMGALIETVAVLRQAAFDKLATAQEIKKAQVENYFTQHIKNISVLSKSTTVIDALKRFRVAFGAEEEGKVGGELYTFLETLFGEALQQFTEEYGYEDLYLITREGTIVYSVAKQADEGQNLLTGPLSDSLLAQGFRKGLQGIAFQDFAPYMISNNRYFGFLVAPIVARNRIHL